MALRSTRPRRARGWFLVPIVAGAVFALWAAFRAGTAPAISIEPGLPGIGKRTPVTIELVAPGRGLAGVRVELAQGERTETLAERSHLPSPAWKLWGDGVEQDTIQLEVGSATIAGLKEGPATLRVTAERAPAWLRRPRPVVEERTLDVRLRPPTVQVRSAHTYVTQGGAEAVVYDVGESSVADGVRAGSWWFPGYPLPGGGERRRFALFSAPYDTDSAAGIRLVARDALGNEAQVAFIDRFTPRPVRRDTIQLDDAFIERVVPQILSQTPEVEEAGDPLATYLAINKDLRRKNGEQLIELARESAAEFLWRQPFLPMQNAAVKSSFADRRTYVYQGRAVDQQDHLGFDLASTRQAPVQAANDGVTVLARYFGIYGNAVVLDHGYGLMTLYGHLSSLEVAEGQRVARGQVLGRSGDTGLAGGDHLHFTILLHGLPVDPREWWDGHWIHDRLELKLGPALPFGG